MTQLICGILRLDGAQPDPAPDNALVKSMASSMIAAGLRHEIRIASNGPVTMAAIRLAGRGVNPGSIEASLIETSDTLLVADISIYDRTRLRLSDQVMEMSDSAFLQKVLAARGSVRWGISTGISSLPRGATTV